MTETQNLQNENAILLNTLDEMLMIAEKVSNILKLDANSTMKDLPARAIAVMLTLATGKPQSSSNPGLAVLQKENATLRSNIDDMTIILNKVSNTLLLGANLTIRELPARATAVMLELSSSKK